MRAPLLVYLSLLISLGAGCASGGEEVPEDMVWTPALDGAGEGHVDFGTLVKGVDDVQMVQIIGENHSDHEIDVTIDCSGLADGDFVASCPNGAKTTVPYDSAAEEIDAQVGVAVRLFPSDVGGQDGSVQFLFDNQIVTFVVSAEVVDE